MKTEKATTETAEPRPLMGLLKCFGWGVLSLAVAVVIAMTWHRSSMASKLKDTLAELDRTEPAWRFDDIEAAREDVPEEENSARVIVTAARWLPRTWPSADFREEEFRLYYQPIWSCTFDQTTRTAEVNELIGAEALIRWHHPQRGLLSPGHFMPVANTSPASEPIAAWVLETACRQARAWQLSGHPLRVGVNLSPSQLHTGDLAGSVAAALAATGLTPSLLELEVTEDILLLDEQRVLDTFQRIQQLGVRIVFDDFGTGYASLSYLKKFPLDGLKIDRSFVLNALIDHDDAAIVSSTITLSAQLGLSVIAEGIENSPTADLLASMGCEEGQGYFFGRPVPVVEFESQFLASPDTRARSLAG